MKKKKLERDTSGISGMPKTVDTKHLVGKPGKTGKREYKPKKMPTDKRFVTQDDLNKWGTI